MASTRSSRLARAFVAGAFGVFCGWSAHAQSIQRPVIVVGDSWSYRDTMETGKSGWTQTRDEAIVTRVTASTIYFTTREIGSPANVKERLANLEWGRSRSVNGKETLVTQPLSFPLTPGKSWDVQFTEKQPNSAHLSETWTGKYVVVGFEAIEVPAGKFNAIKVECEGQWTAEIAPAQRIRQSADSTVAGVTAQTEVQKITPRTTSGRYYRAYWYVPEVKNFVKSVEEYYDSNNIRNERYTGELESYKLVQ